MTVVILTKTSAYLLSNPTNLNFGFKSQIDRLLNIIIDLKNKVKSIGCIDICKDTPTDSFLLSTLIETILYIVTVLETFNALLIYINTTNCNIAKVFELMMGKFINTISCIQDILRDWYHIVLTYLHYSSIPSKPYVASYIPRSNVPPPPPYPPHNNHYCPPKPQNNINNNCT